VKIAVSFLKYKESIKRTIEEIDRTDADFLHVDVMDGKFVENSFLTIEELQEILPLSKKKLDVHLMVENPDAYIETLVRFNPFCITIHAELQNALDYIKKIKNRNILSGIAINPETKIDTIKFLLDEVDLVLIMGVNPGKGGQELQEVSVHKIKELDMYRSESKHSYLIAIDGGINQNTIKKISDVDICVIGSAISLSDDYQLTLDEIKKIGAR